MENHDCEKCPSKGTCTVEDSYKKMKEVFAEKGMPGLVDALTENFNSPVEFASTLRGIVMTLGGDIDALHQFKVLAYQKADKFPAGAADGGLKMVFSSLYKSLSEEMVDDTLQKTKRLAAALGVEPTLTAVKMTGKQLNELLGDAMSEAPPPKPTKPLTFH